MDKETFTENVAKIYFDGNQNLAMNLIYLIGKAFKKYHKEDVNLGIDYAYKLYDLAQENDAYYHCYWRAFEYLSGNQGNNHGIALVNEIAEDYIKNFGK